MFVSLSKNLLSLSLASFCLAPGAMACIHGQSDVEYQKEMIASVAKQEDETLEELTQDILMGRSRAFKEVSAGELPKGPMGAKSILTILFLDDDLKIGTAPNVYTGEVELFILERVRENSSY